MKSLLLLILRLEAAPATRIVCLPSLHTLANPNTVAWLHGVGAKSGFQNCVRIYGLGCLAVLGKAYLPYVIACLPHTLASGEMLLQISGLNSQAPFATLKYICCSSSWKNGLFPLRKMWVIKPRLHMSTG